MRLVPKPQKSSPFGSDVEVSDEPGTWGDVVQAGKGLAVRARQACPRSVISAVREQKGMDGADRRVWLKIRQPDPCH